MAETAIDNNNKSMNNLNISSSRKIDTFEPRNIDEFELNFEKLSLGSEKETETKSSKSTGSDDNDDTVVQTNRASGPGYEQGKTGKNERETTSVSSSMASDHHSIEKHDTASCCVQSKGPGKMGETEQEAADVTSSGGSGEVQTSGQHSLEKGDTINVYHDTTAPADDFSASGKDEKAVDISKSLTPHQSEEIVEEQKVPSMQDRGPTFGLAVTPKPTNSFSISNTNFNGQVPQTFNFHTSVDQGTDTDPPLKFRRGDKLPQEHEDPSSSSPDLLFARYNTCLDGEDPMFADICPSLLPYNSDEFKRLKEDLIRGAEHLQPVEEKQYNTPVKEENKEFSPGRMGCPQIHDKVLSSTTNQTEGNFNHILPSLNEKIDSGDMRDMMKDLDTISMDTDNDTKVISVTDLIEGSSDLNETTKKMSPLSEYAGASPYSVCTNSPYSDNLAPGSSCSSSPAETPDESSQDSFASSKRHSGGQGQNKLSIDQLPKPDISSLMIGEKQSQSSALDQKLKANSSQAPTTRGPTTTQEKAKKSSSSKSKSKGTGRPRGRPPKSARPAVDKSLARPLPNIAPKPMIPQVVTTGATTLIIVQSPISTSAMAQPGGVVNAQQLALKHAVTIPAPMGNTAYPGMNLPPVWSETSGKSSSNTNTVDSTQVGKKMGARRPVSLTKEMLPSEKDQKNLKKAERIVKEIPQSKLTYQDPEDGDTLLHFLSLSNTYEELIEQLFDNSQSLLTVGIPKEKFIYKALIERMHSEGILNTMINKQNKQNQTPLYLAMSTSKCELVPLLLEKGADPNICATRKFNGGASGFCMPLHVAASKGKSHLSVLKLLLECPHIEVDATNSERKTALHCAVEAHNPPTVDSYQTAELLLQHKAKLLRGPNEQTPLHTIIEKKDPEFLKFIVNLLPASDRKTLLNTRDSMGNTCLHLCAVKTRQKDNSGRYFPSVVTMMRFLLLVCEVDIGIVNQKNETAKKLVCKENEAVMTVYKDAENRRRNRKSRDKMQEMEAERRAQLHRQMFPNMQFQPAANQSLGQFSSQPNPTNPMNGMQQISTQLPVPTYLAPGATQSQPCFTAQQQGASQNTNITSCKLSHPSTLAPHQPQNLHPNQFPHAGNNGSLHRPVEQSAFKGGFPTQGNYSEKRPVEQSDFKVGFPTQGKSKGEAVFPHGPVEQSDFKMGFPTQGNSKGEAVFPQRTVEQSDFKGGFPTQGNSKGEVVFPQQPVEQSDFKGGFPTQGNYAKGRAVFSQRPFRQSDFKGGFPNQGNYERGSAFPHRNPMYQSQHQHISGENNFCNKYADQTMPDHSMQSGCDNLSAAPVYDPAGNLSHQTCQAQDLSMLGFSQQLQQSSYGNGIKIENDIKPELIVESCKENDDLKFEDLEKLLVGYSEADGIKLESGMVPQNNNNSTTGPGWHVPVAGTMVQYEASATSGNHAFSQCSTSNNHISPNGQLVSNGNAYNYPVKAPSFETTKNSFLEQLVNSDCGATKRPTENTEGELPLYLQKLLSENPQSGPMSATVDPSYLPNLPSTARSNQNSSTAVTPTHPGSVINQVPAYTCNQIKSENNALSGTTGIPSAVPDTDICWV